MISVWWGLNVIEFHRVTFLKQRTSNAERKTQSVLAPTIMIRQQDTIDGHCTHFWVRVRDALPFLDTHREEDADLALYLAIT